MKSFICTLGFLVAFVPLFAEISFHSPDINPRNEVLFSVKADIPGGGSYRTLFKKAIDSGKLEELTFYPEAMESLSSGSVLQIRNRFGTGRYNAVSGEFSWVEDFTPFFAGGNPVNGSLPSVLPSPDGLWQVSIEPVSPARGRLILFDTRKGVRFVLSESVERGAVPVSWAPDSSVLIYALSGTLYFARPESFFSTSLVDEKFRILGPGSINSVSWFSSSRFLYVSGCTVYRVQASVLFSRALYSPLIGPGEMAGKLPFNFDTSEDSFCASPDGDAVLFAKDNRNVYYCPLGGDDYTSSTRPALLPYLLLPGNTACLSFIWSADGIPAVFADSVTDGKKTLSAWRVSDISGGKIFTPLPVPSGTTSITQSMDRGLAAFVSPQGVQVYTTSDWKEAGSFSDETVVSAAWADNQWLYIGGTETVRKWNYKTGGSSVLLLSSVNSWGWDDQGTTVLGDLPKLGRFSYSGNMHWIPAAAARLRPSATSANDSWRIYTDSGKGYYANMLYLRSAKNPGGTKPLVTEPSITLDSLEPAPVAPGTGADSSDVLRHGSRTNSRQVALVFDAMDSLDGLPRILLALDRYRIRATFFINGEFIREHPVAVNEIVKAGHQCASLFFTTWDLGGTQYRIDEDFIMRGLSRNEDDFYTATGQELTLLWHAPYYVASPMILRAGEKAGYRYVSPDVQVLDWVTAEQDRSMPGLYRNSATLIEDIIAAKKPGSIIPVRIGKVPGTRSDYLYQKIDLLINALVESGYEIVPIDTLEKNMR